MRCADGHWHPELTEANFVDLAVATRLVFEDTIWCLDQPGALETQTNVKEAA